MEICAAYCEINREREGEEQDEARRQYKQSKQTVAIKT